jgi:muramoyltetrapeptide carboxypeptidase
MKETPIIPPYLSAGDKVAIVSPSGVVEPGPVQAAKSIIEGWGLEVITGPNMLASEGQFAGTDDSRISDMQEALDDPTVKAIICSRGGYGMSRIIDRIDFAAFTANPKWIVGYSDITVLHLWVQTLFGITTIHGEMPLHYSNPAKTPETITSVRDLLFGKPLDYEWQGNVVNPVAAEGIITGGNLALMFSLTGTVARPETEGKILFIEDTGEYYYSVDRMLHSLRLAGMLDNLAALLVGDFGDMKDNRIPFGKTVEEIVTNVAGGYGYPVYFGFPAGHCDDNIAFCLGRGAKISSDKGINNLKYL